MPTPDHRYAVGELVRRRILPAQRIAEDAEAVARTCHAVADRFRCGGKLIVFGNGGSATDAQHISVEFVHPVIVGKRSLPAITLTADGAAVTGVANREGFEEVFAHQLRLFAEPADIALGISSNGDCSNVLRGLEAGHERGLLTVGMVGGDGGVIARSPAVDHVLIADSDDPRVVKEVHVTTYHVLWELVHVFLDQPGVVTPETGPAARDRVLHHPPTAVRIHECSDDVCVTCSDEAVPVRVVRMLGDGLAVVDTGSGQEEVSVALVAAQAGDTVLLHAKEAIAVVGTGDDRDGRFVPTGGDRE